MPQAETPHRVRVNNQPDQSYQASPSLTSTSFNFNQTDGKNSHDPSFLNPTASSPLTDMSHQTNGFTTSIDLVRRQTYPTPLAGQKRPAADSHAQPSSSKLQQGSGSGSRGADRLIASRTHPVAANNTVSPAEPEQATGTGTGTGTGTEPEGKGSPLLSLENPIYSLPKSLTANFAALGISSIYAWQASCLLSPGLLTGQRHLVYTAPTGGGKSLVADVLMLKRVIDNPGRKAILVLPYVALVQEKLKWLRRVVRDVERVRPSEAHDGNQGWAGSQEIRVTGFFGGNRTAASWKDMDIAVCTIEKVSASSPGS